MLTFYAPLVIYLMSVPIMLLSFRRAHIGALYFVSIVPIIAVMTKITQFPMGHNWADIVLVTILLASFLQHMRETGSIFERSTLNVVVILVMLGSVINLIRGYTFMALPDEINLTRLMAWKNYMILPLIYFVGINAINKESLVKWLLICVCFSMLAMDFNFYSTFRWLRAEHYSHGLRISGPFSFLGPNEMGVFFVQYTFLLLGISYFVDDRRLKGLMLFVCACNMYPIVYSYSRGAYLTTCATLIGLGILKDRRLLVVMFVLITMYSAILPKSVVERIDMTFLDKEETSEERLATSSFDIGDTTFEAPGRKILWEKALAYFESQPLLGIGFDTFRHREGWITHSKYMKILAEQGLLGVMIFLVFTTCILRESYKLFRHSNSRLGRGIGLGVLVSEIAHIVGSTTGDQSMYYNLMAIRWLFLGIVGGFNAHPADSGEHNVV